MANIIESFPTSSPLQNSMSTPSRRHLISISVVYGALLVLALFLHYRELLLSHFDALPGDGADSRFINIYLEHWWLIFHGKPDWRTMLMLYPMRNTLAWSDLLALIGMPYSVFRLFGWNMFSAYQATLVCLSVVGFAGMAALLRMGFGCGHLISAFGALLFVENLGMYEASGHPQLYAVMYVPWLFLAILRFVRADAPVDARLVATGAAAVLLLGGLMLTAFYIAWSAGFLVLTLLVIRLVQVKRESGWSEARRLLWEPFRRIGRWKWMLVGLGMPIFSVFFWLYIPVVFLHGGRPYRHVVKSLPTISGLVDVSSANWLWTWVLSALSSGWLAEPVRRYQGALPPVLCALFLGITAYWWWVKLHPNGARAWTNLASAQRWMGYLTGAVLLNWLVMLRVGQFSLWILVFNLVPGANGLREMSRHFLVLFIPVIAVCCIGFEHWQRCLRSTVSAIGIRAAALGFLIALLVMEQLGIGSFVNLRKSDQLALLKRAGSPPVACKVFQLEPVAQPTQSSLYYFADAMIVAYATGVPTLHGFTGYQLKDQDDRDPTKPGYVQGAARWWADHGIQTGICALDDVSGRWRMIQ